MMRRLTATLVLLLLLNPADTPQPRAADLPELSAEEQQLLGRLDPELLAEATEIAKQVTTWQKDLKALRDQLQEAKEAPPATTIAPIVEALVKRSAPFRELIGVRDELRTELRTWQDRAAGEAARLKAARRVVEDELGKVMRLLDQLKNPAAFAQNFLQERLSREFLDRPYEVGDIVFRLVPQSHKKSPFSPDANIAIVIVYSDEIKVEATGLYFKYDRQLPIPQFDKVKPKTNLADLAKARLAGLGDLLPALSGAGIKLQDVRLEGLASAGVGLQKDSRGRVGGLSFGIQLDDLLDFLPDIKPKMEGRVILYAKRDGRPDVKAEGIKVDLEVPMTPPTPLPGGLFLEKYGVKLQPDDAKKGLEIRLWLSPSPGTKDALALELSLTLGLRFPISEVGYRGALLLGGRRLAQVEGKLSRREISGSVILPHPDMKPLENIVKARGAFLLNSDGFSVDATASVFRLAQRSFDLLIRFDGSGGHLALKEEISLFGGITASGSVEATFGRSLDDLKLTANLMVEVDVGIFPHAEISVEAVATLRGVDIVAKGLGARVDFHLPGPDGNLLAALRDEFEKKVGGIADDLFEGAKDLDLFNKNSAIRKGLAKNLEKASKAAKRAAEELKNVGNAIEDGLEQAAEDAKEFAADAWEPIEDGRQYIQDNLPIKVKPVSEWFSYHRRPGLDLFRPGYALSREPVAPLLPHPLAALTLTTYYEDDDDDAAAMTKQLKRLRRAINKEKVYLAPAATIHTSGGRQYREQTELRLRFGQATVAPSDKGTGAALLFAVHASGYHAKVHSNDPSRNKRKHGSEMKWVEIEFDNLLGDRSDNPTARIRFKGLDADYTSLPARDIVRDRIQDLIERYLPDVTMEGRSRKFDRRLTIENPNDEPVTVWVQYRTQTFSEQNGYQWKWLPAEPGRTEALKFKIPARGKEAVGVEKLERLNAGTFAGKPVKGEQVKVKRLIAASRIRYWAESESGNRWTSYQDKDQWLVDPDPNFENRRRYYARERETFIQRLTPNLKDRPWTDRLVAVRNDTEDKLTVKLRYRETEDGVTKWRSLAPMEVEADGRAELRRPDGLRLRASALTFEAAGEKYQFDRHRDKPLWLVEEVGGQRLYRGTKIGTYELTLSTRKTKDEPKKEVKP